MVVISISEAARTWRIARSTLQRAIQEGRLSATVRADGSKGIDTVELIRVFGEAPGALQERGSSEVQRATSIAADPTIATLQAQVNSLQALLQEARQRETWLQTHLPSCSEQKSPCKLWKLLKKRRVTAWDLSAYTRAGFCTPLLGGRTASALKMASCLASGLGKVRNS